jgi:hypothetical protein
MIHAKWSVLDMAREPLESAEGGDLIEEGDEFVVELSDDKSDAGSPDDAALHVAEPQGPVDEGDPDEKSGTDHFSDEEVTEEELRSYSQKVQKRINSLTARQHAERRAKDEAAGERDEAARLASVLVNENNRLKNLLNKGEQVLVGEAKTRLSSELKSAQNALTAALDLGDSQAITDAQSELARIMAQTERVNSYRPQELPPTPPPQFQSQPRPDPKAEKWRSGNRWFGRDEEMTAYAMGLHQRLVGRDGIPTESDEYYEEIDRNMRKRFPERFQPSRTGGKTVVAPAQRSSARGRTVTLTESQVRLAKRLNIPAEDYAREYLKENPDG